MGVVGMGDLVERERAEHDLAFETEQVEGMGAVGGVEGAEARPRAAADVEHPGFELGHHLGVDVAPIELLASLLDRLE